MSKSLGLYAASEADPKMTVAAYRASRAQKKAKQDTEEAEDNGTFNHDDRALIIDNSDLTGLKTDSPKSPIGLMSTTILEEDDSSDIGFG